MSIMTGKYKTDGNHFSMGCATGNHSRLVLSRLMPSESLPKLVLFPKVVGPLKSPPLSGVKTHPWRRDPMSRWRIRLQPQAHPSPI